MSSKRSAPRRSFPLGQLLFVVVLLGVAGLISWLSGRTLVLAELFSPVLGGIQAVTNSWSGGVERLQSIKQLESENTRLKREIQDMEHTLSTWEEQARENARLRELMKLEVPAAAQPLVVARVVGRNPDNWHQRVLVDKGADLGVKVDTVVADRRGLVGRVVTVSPHTAQVTLITDPTSDVSVLNTRTRSAGVIHGQGDEWPTLRFLDQPEKWKVGDRLVTSGFGGIFPKGLTVGKVVQIKKASDMFQPELRVQTNVALGRLEEVILLPPGIAAMPVPSPKPKPSPVGSPKPGDSPKPKPSAGPR